MDNWKINDALKAVWIFIRSLNKYIDVTMPWVLAKDEAKRAALDAVLYHLCEGMRFVSLMVEPVIPIAAEKIWAQLGLVDFEKANYKNLVWGGIADGTKVAKGMPIFPRIEVEKEDLKAEVKSERKFNVKKTENDTSVPLITMDDFLKTELRVAEILTAEKIENQKS